MKRIISMALCLILTLSLFVPITTFAASPIKDGKIYYIYSKLDSNKVIDVDNAGTENGVNIQLYGHNGTNAQKFKISWTNGNYYKIESVCSKKVLDVAGGSKNSGTNVQQYKWNKSNAQKWTFIDAGDGYYYIKSALGTYLDVKGGKTADGTNIWAYKGNKSDSQKWRIISADATYTTKTVTINANSLEDWAEQIKKTESSLTGGNFKSSKDFIYETDGSRRYTGKVIADREILSYKTIKAKLPIFRQGPKQKVQYRTVKVKIPQKIKYTIHKCDIKNNVDAAWVGAFMNGLVNQQLVFTQSCACGYSRQLVWDIPLPDPSDFKTPEIVTIRTESKVY